jgi:hypothetical protein
MNSVSEDLFKQLQCAYAEIDKTNGDNMCPTCQIEMMLDGSEYSCLQCGYSLKMFVETETRNDIEGGTIRLASGGRKGRLYTINGSGAQLRKRLIMSLLLQNQAHYAGIPFPLNVLTTVVNQYNDIQVKYTEVNVDKKFVHRAAIKDEILAGLIKFECIKCGITRKNKDIAMFMRLATSGFAKGENMLRELHAQGIIDIPINEDPIVGYLPRYLEALNISNERYYDFVAELVDYSEAIHMGYRSQISSKIVGALWIIIRKEKLPISDKDLEKAADNTKKNTFVKFYDLVMNNIDVFVDIFNKYEIPYCD